MNSAILSLPDAESLHFSVGEIMGTVLSDLLVPITDGFRDKELFGHFRDPRHPRCFACNSESMVVRPYDVTNRYILMQATTRKGDDWYVMRGCWLVFPRGHVTRPEQMPTDWSVSLSDAAALLRLGSYNTSQNWGKSAGQTIDHAHTWLIDREVMDPIGSLTEDKGMATILFQIWERGL